MNGFDVDTFKRKLIVPVIVVVIQISPPIMHGKKLSEPHLAVQLLMFLVMLNEHRKLCQLSQYTGISSELKKQQEEQKPGHAPKVENLGLFFELI